MKQENALKICQTLKVNNYQAVYAGGCVRDLLLDIEPNDIDIATNACPEIIQSLFEHTLDIGKSFGVITVIIDNEQFEVATFRSDGIYEDGRRPSSIVYTSLESDAKRRDITINGMFYNPFTKQIIDVVNGQADLKNKTIRLIESPEERILEDKLRILRCVRFSAKLDFVIEKTTFNAIKQHAHMITQVSVERIAEELTKILRTKNKQKEIQLLFDTNLIDYVLPEVKKLNGCLQSKQHHPEGDVYVHTLLALSKLPENVPDGLLWGTLLHDIGKPQTQLIQDGKFSFNGHESEGEKITEQILRRLKFSNDSIKHICALVSNHMKFKFVHNMRLSRLKRFMNLDKFEEHMQLHLADCLASTKNTENYYFLIEKLKTYTPEKREISKLPKLITGNDLIEMGFLQGPIFRTILEDIQEKQLEETINSREQALSYVKLTYVISKFRKD